MGVEGILHSQQQWKLSFLFISALWGQGEVSHCTFNVLNPCQWTKAVQSFAQAIVMYCHTLGGLKQHQFLHQQFCRQVWNQGSAQLYSLWRLYGKPVPWFFQLLVSLGFPCLVVTSVQHLLWLYVTFSVCVSVSKLPLCPSYKNTCDCS